MKDKITWKTILWALVKTGIISFLLYLMSYMIIGAIFENHTDDEKSNAAACIAVIFHGIIYYRVQTRKEIKQYSLIVNSDTNFDLMSEIKSFFSLQGKYLICIYGILAVANEIGFLICIANDITPSILGMILFSTFPLVNTVIRIPFVGSLVNIIINVVFTAFLAIANKYMITVGKQLNG